MFSSDFIDKLIDKIAEKVYQILKEKLVLDRRFNQKELCKELSIGQDTLAELNIRGLRPTKVGRQYIYLESELNKFLKENKI
mgnify:FL=1|jgi:hypothetical protein